MLAPPQTRSLADTMPYNLADVERRIAELPIKGQLWLAIVNARRCSREVRHVPSVDVGSLNALAAAIRYCARRVSASQLGYDEQMMRQHQGIGKLVPSADDDCQPDMIMTRAVYATCEMLMAFKNPESAASYAALASAEVAYVRSNCYSRGSDLAIQEYDWQLQLIAAIANCTTASATAIEADAFENYDCGVFLGWRDE